MKYQEWEIPGMGKTRNGKYQEWEIPEMGS
jgi:hypothetical protein